MKKNSTSHSAFFNPRVFAAFLLCSGGAWLAMLSFASTPSSGTLSTGTPVLTYTAGPFNVPNQSPLGAGQLDVGPRCDATTFPCDNFTLTVTLPAGYVAAHPNSAVKVTMGWGDTGSGKSDYDLYIYNGVVDTLDGSVPADHQSASGANPEVGVINPLADGTTQYSIKIVPFQPTNEILTVNIELLPGSPSVFPGFGSADPTTPGVPRYQIFVAPTGSSAESGQGEFNIGFDPITHRIMAMNIGPVWRLTPGEVQTPTKPECCEALWEDKSANSTNIGLDPILWTDQKSGRTFVSNSTAGANAVYAYTDAAAPFNDGDLWVEGSASPPSFSDDHETIGSGPYPLVAGLPNPLSTAANQGEAVYYCGQTFPVGSAECQRSDSLGVSYGTGVVVYNGTTSACSGLHGHVHVAPDGTVWLPVPHCGTKQGGALSTDSGITWTEFTVPGSKPQPQGADPSIAIDADSTVYFAYVNDESVPSGNPPEGHAHVKVGHRNPMNNNITWSNDRDLGTLLPSHGVVNAVEIEAVGGSSGRAAVGFLGTNVNGDYQANGFPGKWYVFIATTYDGGDHWNVVNATPNDPVQSMTGVWQQGGGHDDRNLLDFNEITVDDKGRVLYGYSDGCTSGPCITGTGPNDFGAFMRVARQFGGKPMLAAFDVTEPVAPKPACLSGTRDSAASHLTWKMPDNGGSDITGYVILRGTTAGSETVIVPNTGNAKTTYNDTTADPSVPHYFYVVKAINAQGTGLQSNEIDLIVAVLPPPESACILPGLTILTDQAGDLITPTGQTTNPGWDVRSLHLAEPFTFAPNKVVFTLKMESLATVPPNTRWPVTFSAPNGTNYTVRMTNSPIDGATTAPIFQVGPNGGTFVAADAASNFNADGTITIVVPTSAIGNPTVGQKLTSFLTRITVTAPPNPQTSGLTPDNMPDSLSPTGAYTLVGNSTGCFPLLSVVSRKTHQTAGDFDINLPLAGTAGIECRSGGGTNAYTLVYTLNRNVTVAGTATKTQGTATVGTPTIGLGPNANQVTVPLTGVTNIQHLIITLNGVQGGGEIFNNLAARMDVLLGDTNADGSVNSSDIGQTKSQSFHPVGSSNFREDVNADGSINSSDIGLVKSKSFTALPP